MKQQGRLIYGLAYNGQTYHEFALTRLTVGGELRALEMAEAHISEEKKESDDYYNSTIDNLANVAVQLSVDGIPKEALDIDYLLDNLATEDFDVLIAAQEILRAKYLATGVSQASVAENPTLAD